MKAKLLRRFRERFTIAPSAREGYDFLMMDHATNRVSWFTTSHAVARFCASQLLGISSAWDHEYKHIFRKYKNDPGQIVTTKKSY